MFSKSSRLKKFNARYFIMKVALYKALTDQRETLNFPSAELKSEDLCDVFLAKASEYMLGSDISDESQLHPNANVKKNRKVLKFFPAAGEKFVQDNPELAEPYLEAIKYKYECLRKLLGAEWTESKEAQLTRERHRDLTQEYLRSGLGAGRPLYELKE